MISNEYLQPTLFIDFQSEIVSNLAQELSVGKDKVETAIYIFNYVRDEIKYTIRIDQYKKEDDFRASTTIQKKKGFCIPKSVTLVALLRANGIPSRLHFADIINHRIPPRKLEILKTNVMLFHAYAEVYLNKWIKLTPSFQTPLCERHNFPVCTFNGTDDAIFKSHDILGNTFVDYINDRGVYSDLPFKDILDTFAKHYGYMSNY